MQKACKLGLAKAQINKPASPHTMRHTFATSMLEAGVDLLTISKLLGHASFVTTMIYLHVRRQHFERSPSPIDWMPVRQCPQWAEVDPVAKQPPTVQQELTTRPSAQDIAPVKPAEQLDMRQTQRRTSGHSQNKSQKRRRPG